MKKAKLLLCMLCVIFLTGCSVDKYFEEKLVERSGVVEREEYTQYQRYVESGGADEKLMQQDKYGVQVSFAKNENLDIDYYVNKDVLVQDSSCMLLPGDCIYADVHINSEVENDMYRFSNFAIYEYKEDGKRVRRVDIENLLEAGQALVIPEDFSGTEISIEPVGIFMEREIGLRDYYVEADGEYELDGDWFIDDKVYSENVAEVSPFASYIISYEYDADEYFYVSSEPECFYNSYEDGIVIFPQREERDDTIDYSVELHKYLVIELKSDADRSVSVGGGNMKSLKTGEMLTLSKLRYGEKVFIETDKKWADLDTCRELILTSTELLSNGNYKYSFVVPERGGEFIFNPLDYQYEHGKVQFKCFGSVITDTQLLAKGSKIYFEELTADVGYWLPIGKNYIVVGETEETKRQLEDISFVPKVKASIHLSQPQYGGTIKYFVDGERVFTKEYDSYSGTIISMEFEPWEGWICDATNGKQIIMGNRNNQVVLIDGKSVDTFFREDQGHKPKLTLTLDESVGTNMEFSIVAPGLSEEKLRYSEELFKKEKIVIDNVAIGTERGIEITMGNRAIEAGKAIKIKAEIIGVNEENNKTYILYSDESTKHTKTIEVYPDRSNSYSKKSYKSISIKISVVDVEKLKIPNLLDNTYFTVKHNETEEVLAEGAFIEAGTNVKISILPKAGYYIANTKEDQYHEVMKYSDYEKKIEEIIQKYPASKIYAINLDKSDAYANYVYKLEGKEVNGTIWAREGQKLTLEYKIIDAKYKLTDGSGGFFGIGKSYSEIVKELIITDELENKTVTKADFGICVEENDA